MSIPENALLDYEDARIAAWILTGLHHEYIRLGKKQKKIVENELLILNKRMSEDAEDRSEGIVDKLAAEEEKIEDLIIVRDYLSVLTIQQQKVIRAIIYEERSEREVAEQLGVTKQAVNKLKVRALRRLKEITKLIELE